MQCHYRKCRISLIVMLGVIMLNAIVLSVILSVIFSTDILPNVYRLKLIYHEQTLKHTHTHTHKHAHTTHKHHCHAHSPHTHSKLWMSCLYYYLWPVL
jgi:hypothetical protein